MYAINRSRRAPLLALILLVPSGLGCGGEPAEPESAPASALRQRFPERAALVLERGEALVGTGDGFALDRPSALGAYRGDEVVLPRDGQEAIRFRGFGGVEVRVRELGVEGEGALVERAVAYRRAGGTSFWTAAQTGLEEWLHLEASSVRAGEPAAVWEVETATVRQRGEGVEVVDEGGVVRLSVTAPVAYAEGGREVHVWLEGSGSTIALHVDAAGEAVLIDPIWTAVPSMVFARTDHTATLLQSGKVLVAGGYGYSSAELFDPAINTWSPAGSMSQGRSGHAATLLPSGRVLITGGVNGTNLASTDIYDPTANTWSPAAPMLTPRNFHTATLLPNGKVLAAGGGGTTAEIYDPVTNTWSPAGTMIEARLLHTATLLPNGKVLMAGGFVASAELYDPETGKWSPTGSMTTSRARHTATLLPSGKVLVAGGVSSSYVASAELYDPATGTWSPTNAMSTARAAHIALLLPSGRVLVSGSATDSASLASAELYDPATSSWSSTSSMVHARARHTATLLPSGDVLVAGGQGDQFGVTASAERYDAGSLGAACTTGNDCQSGFCADGVCCDSACNGGACDACSVAAGAPADGTCVGLTGNACNDGDACTQNDTCQAGVCVGANPVTCPVPDQCHTGGVCNPATGMCSSPASVADGTACDDGDGCTQNDTCQAGVCTGSAAVVCTALDTCHVPGKCDPATGVCTNPEKPDTAACDDGNACTQTDTCLGGVCKGTNPVACEAMDECHAAGSCDPETGMCSAPVKPDGAPCAGGTCNAGVCSPAPDGGGGSASSSSSSTGGGADIDGGCGCGVVGAPDLHPAWLGLGLLLARRRRTRGRCVPSGATAR